ncbi:hypothetical protein CORC01_06256 [Colletotrichum orchidophilum]|uniref:BTB domain-containing protein n=1 Tax=Colletotrichum orchidophilum TaxID=1209926 RepID=A0A1G4BAV5_9PEZI|nr:uncharacterized protein CORC01_06256 [Colletotrichum orchidophilum]OHE98465.1 hypothetical protein CORC01_06256 [Colletotrichum orchidophilum]
MENSDLSSLWETKKDADIHLTMGVNKWELHDKVIRGKSSLIDHILEMIQMQEGIRKIPLKEHLFTFSALNTVLKYFYFGEKVVDEKTESIELLAMYEVSATLIILPLQQKIASKTGNLLGDILSNNIEMVGDFWMAAEVIVGEQTDSWVFMRQELQRAIGPHLSMLLRQDTFSNLLKQNPVFCWELLSTAVDHIQILEKKTKETAVIKETRDAGSQTDAKHDTDVSKRFVEAGTQCNIPPPNTLRRHILTAAANDARIEASQEEVTPRPSKPEYMVEFDTEGKVVFNVPQTSRRYPRETDSDLKKGSVAMDQASPHKFSGLSKTATENVALPLTIADASTSDASTQESWESCSEGRGNFIPNTRESEFTVPLASNKAETRTVEVSEESKSQYEERRAVSEVMERMQSGGSAFDCSSYIHEEQTPITGVIERTRREYVLSGSRVSQTEETFAPAIPEWSRRSYAFNSASLPRGYQFTGGSQEEQSDGPKINAAASHAQKIASSSFRGRAMRNPSPVARSSWKADSATAKQIKRGRLVVEPPENYSPLESTVNLDGPPLDCNPS